MGGIKHRITRWRDAWVVTWLVLGLAAMGWWWFHRSPAATLADMAHDLITWAVRTAVAAALIAVGLERIGAQRAQQATRRTALVRRLEAAVAEVAGEGARVRVKKWDGMSPLVIMSRLPATWSTEQPGADAKIRAALKQVTNTPWAPATTTTHDPDGTLVLHAPAAETTEDTARVEAAERAEGLFRQAITGARSVKVTDWTPDGQPARIEATYRPSPAMLTTYKQRSIERSVEAMTGRWKTEWDVKNDCVTFCMRPGLPDLVRRPIGLPKPQSPILRYGVDEDGQYLQWRVDKTQPHALIVGPTGGGKTYLLRAVVLDALGQGMTVYAADPKMVELNGLMGLPGVEEIATEPEDIADLIDHMYDLMLTRYRAIQRSEITVRDLPRVVLVLDEMYILVMRLNRLWQEDPDHKGKVHPALGKIQEMLALARGARIHLALGIQRPDAEFLTGAARDNIRHRASLGTMSPEGARMMWGDVDTGTDLPDLPGRAIATQGNTPVEGQVWQVPNPGDPGDWDDYDRAILAEIFGDSFTTPTSSAGDIRPALPAPPSDPLDDAADWVTSRTPHEIITSQDLAQALHLDVAHATDLLDQLAAAGLLTAGPGHWITITGLADLLPPMDSGEVIEDAHLIHDGPGDIPSRTPAAPETDAPNLTKNPPPKPEPVADPDPDPEQEPAPVQIPDAPPPAKPATKPKAKRAARKKGKPQADPRWRPSAVQDLPIGATIRIDGEQWEIEDIVDDDEDDVELHLCAAGQRSVIALDRWSTVALWRPDTQVT